MFKLMGLSSVEGVSVSSPSQGDMLVYNSTTGGWENSSTVKLHKNTHKTGGTDAISPADIGALPEPSTQGPAGSVIMSDGTNELWNVVSSSMKNKLINGDFSIWQRGANAIPTTLRARTSNVATVTLNRGHGLNVGDVVQITGLTDATFNGGSLTLTAVASNTISYASTGADVASTADTGGRVLITNRPSFAFNNDEGYCADRWKAKFYSANAVVSRKEFVPGQTDVPGEPHYYTNINILNLASSSVYLEQRVEDVRTLAGKNAVLSFYARADAAKTVTSYLYQSFGTGGSSGIAAASKSIALTTAWQKFSVPVTFPSLAGKTIGYGSYVIARPLSFSAGTTGSFDIALCQLEEGSVATPFEQRHPATELALCQRYYEKSYNTDTPPGKTTNFGQVTWVGNGTSSYHQAPVYFKSTKRVSPTVVVFNPATGAASSLRDNTSIADVSATAGDIGLQKCQMLVNNISMSNVALCGHYTADAEI